MPSCFLNSKPQILNHKKKENQNTISYIPILSIADLGNFIFIHVRAHTQNLTGVETTLPSPNHISPY